MKLSDNQCDLVERQLERLAKAHWQKINDLHREYVIERKRLDEMLRFRVSP